MGVLWVEERGARVGNTHSMCSRRQLIAAITQWCWKVCPAAKTLFRHSFLHFEIGTC